MSRLTPAIALPGLAAALLAGALAVGPASGPAAEMTSVRLVAVARPLVPERSPDNDEGDIGQADGSSKSDRSDFGLSGSGTRNARESREDTTAGDDNLSDWFSWMRNTPAPNSAGSSGGEKDKAEKKGDEQQNILDEESKSGKPKSSDAQGGKHSEKDDEGDGGSWIGKLLDSIFSGIAKALG